MSLIKTLWDSPIGIRTTHFWGPAANWGIVLAGLSDINRPKEKISLSMSTAMVLYSALFMRFALRVQPRNLLLFTCHAANETIQLYHWSRAVKYNYFEDKVETPVTTTPAAPVTPVTTKPASTPAPVVKDAPKQ
ncbi:mitochondrial pyruvate carrier 1 [Acrasis kona]|uniref:Mitochondrial pyruvate carrier n=1 Tax=Acrasis kona TaxID=1008807 RepID=A0AAW2ZLN5_9EUKA